MNAVVIFFIFLLSHEVFSVSLQEDVKLNREECVRDISVYFDGYDVYQHGRIAIKNYNEFLNLDQLNVASMDYYKSFKDFLRPGNVQPPEKYCRMERSVAGGSTSESQNKRFKSVSQTSDKTKKSSKKKTSTANKNTHLEYEACYYWITKVFGSEVMDIVHAAFYKYRLFDIHFLHINYPKITKQMKNLLAGYLLSIQMNYDLETTYFKDPGMYCSFKYPLPENESQISIPINGVSATDTIDFNS